MDRQLISQAFADRSLLAKAKQDIFEVIEALDKGQLRVAEKIDGAWQVSYSALFFTHRNANLGASSL